MAHICLYSLPAAAAIIIKLLDVKQSVVRTSSLRSGQDVCAMCMLKCQQLCTSMISQVVPSLLCVHVASLYQPMNVRNNMLHGVEGVCLPRSWQLELAHMISLDDLMPWCTP